jgi:hypothetical protein
VSYIVVDSMPLELCQEFDKLILRIVANTKAMEMEVGSNLLQEIQRGQLEDEKIQEIKHNNKEEKSSGFWKMMKVCCCTGGGFVCLTSRS